MSLEGTIFPGWLRSDLSPWGVKTLSDHGQGHEILRLNLTGSMMNQCAINDIA